MSDLKKKFFLFSTIIFFSTLFTLINPIKKESPLENKFMELVHRLNIKDKNFKLERNDLKILFQRILNIDVNKTSEYFSDDENIFYEYFLDNLVYSIEDIDLYIDKIGKYLTEENIEEQKGNALQKFILSQMSNKTPDEIIKDEDELEKNDKINYSDLRNNTNEIKEDKIKNEDL